MGDTGPELYNLSLRLEARLGVPALICVNGKAALHKRWQVDPFTRPDVVRNRLRRHRGHVGTVMGAGLVGIDLDTYKPEGAETHRMLIELGWLPPTASQRTQSGGLHLLYRYDPDLWEIGCGDFSKVAGPDGTLFPGGAEWKGTGGYLVVYDWDETAVTDIHSALVEALGGRCRDRATGPTELHPKTLEACALLEEHFGGHHRVPAIGNDGTPYVKLTRPGKDSSGGSSVSIGERREGTSFFHTPNWLPFAHLQVVDLWELRQMAGVDLGPKIVVPLSSANLRTFVPAAQVRSERLTWLWKDHIPAGQLVLIAGYEQLGKSSAMVWVGARLTRGDLPGDFESQPMDVCYVSAEDDAEHILKPRAEAAGADLDRFYLLNPQPKAEGYSIDAVRELNPGLVVFDPWSVFMPLPVGSSGNDEIPLRKAMQPFAEMASEGISVCGVRHFRKGSGGDNPQDVVLGSKAWVAAARATVFFVPDPNYRDEPRGLIFPRGNLTRPVPGTCYRLESTDVALDDSTVDSVPVFTLAGGTTITLDEALGPRQTPSARSEAETFLVEALSGGRVPYETIVAAAGEAGISLMTLRRAKKSLGVTFEYEGAGTDRVTYWLIPGKKDDQDDQDDQKKE